MLGEEQGISNDDPPHADIRNGQAFLNDVYNAVRRSPNRRNTVLVITYDEWADSPIMFFDENQKPADYRFIEVNPAFEQQAGMGDATGRRMLGFVSRIEPHRLENYGKVKITGEPMRGRPCKRLARLGEGSSASNGRGRPKPERPFQGA